MIEIRNVTKRFGSLIAVNDLSLEIGAGEVFGFIGPNGAGKSTTMKILACLLAPDAGTAKVGGLDVTSDGDRIRQILGYMPDFLGVYDDLTVDEYLQFFAAAFRIPRKKRGQIIDSVLELTDLVEKKKAMVSSLSRGMQQRLGVARVLIHEPKVLLLDEPASGLDPRARIEMRSLLQELARMGKSLMVSSHILSELAEMCTTIGIIERGKLLYAGSIKAAYARTRPGEQIEVRLESPMAAGGANGLDAAADSAGDGNVIDPDVLERARAALEGDARVHAVAVVASPRAALQVSLVPGEHSHHFIIERLLGAGLRIAAFTPKEVRLEEAFLKLTTGALQ